MGCELNGKTCLVTGAASGIGAACARGMAAAGAERLLLVDSDETGLTALKVDCATDLYPGDVTDERLWDRIEASGTGIDAAALVAGIAGGGTIAETEFAEWRRVLGVNLDGMFLSLRAAMRLARDDAAIVLTASTAGLKAESGIAAYGASKAGVIQLAKVAAKEGASRGVRVNVIAPGGVDTPLWDRMPFFQELTSAHGGDRDAALTAMAGESTLLGRFARPTDITAQILFLMSPASATTTGAVIVSDGGYSL